MILVLIKMLNMFQMSPAIAIAQAEAQTIDPVSTILNAENTALALAVVAILGLVYAVKVQYKDNRADRASSAEREKEYWQSTQNLIDALKEIKNALERSRD